MAAMISTTNHASLKPYPTLKHKDFRESKDAKEKGSYSFKHLASQIKPKKKVIKQ